MDSLLIEFMCHIYPLLGDGLPNYPTSGMILVCFINVPQNFQGQPINTALGIPPDEMGMFQFFLFLSFFFF